MVRIYFLLYKGESNHYISYGGVLGCNEEMTIVCKNTVDSRLELCFQDSLPPIRAILFPSK